MLCSPKTVLSPVIVLEINNEMYSLNLPICGRGATGRGQNILNPTPVPKTGDWNPKLNSLRSHIEILNVIYLLKNAVFWDVTPCSSCKNRRFGGT
jgi:hypothetical protein